MMRRTPLVCLLCVLALATACAPAFGILYVKWDAPGAQNGNTWNDAYHTIAAALANPRSFSEPIWVAGPHTYVENLNVPPNAALYGGFAGNEDPSLFNLNQRNFALNQTIIEPLNDSVSIITAAGGRIDGFTLRNGRANLGAAIRCIGPSCSVVKCFITGNISQAGAGIFAQGTGVEVSECTFADNTARSVVSGGVATGGAISLAGGGFSSIARCVFARCVTTGTTGPSYATLGGAIYSTNTSLKLENNIIYDCASLGIGYPGPARGGAVACEQAQEAIFDNNTFVGNRVTPHAGDVTVNNRSYGLGAAIFLQNVQSARIVNNILTESRGTAVVAENASVYFDYNLLWHNAGGDIYGFDFPVLNNDHNIMKSPQFLDPDSDNYHITVGSPARNAGLREGTPALDFDGEVRVVPGSPHKDIGADEFVDTDGDGGANVDPRETSPTEITPAETDDDGDGVHAPYDNCEGVFNPNQADSNGDGVGDACTGNPPVYYVRSDVAASGDGLSWATALKTIQEGIDAADLHNRAGWGSNPEVWVKAGVYRENICIWHGVAVYGGWAGTETPSPDVYAARNLSANTSIIEAAQAGSVVTIAHLPQDRYLTGIHKSVYRNAVTTLNGFTVRGGNAEIGGGVSIYKDYANVTACRIENNRAVYGGGVYIYDSKSIVGDGIGPAPGNILTEDTAIVNNVVTGQPFYGGYGGGIYIERGFPTIFANLIYGNSAAFGGGMAVFQASAIITQNLIGCQSAPNVASGVAGFGLAGGIQLEDATAMMNKNTIVYNIAAGAGSQGGGIWSIRANYTLRNSIVAFNSAGTGEAITAYNTTAKVTYTDFYPAGPNTVVGLPDLTKQLTNYTLDPLFENAAACNYRLQHTPPISPLINAGDPVDGSPNLGAFQDVDPIVSIGDARTTENGVTVDVRGGVVTAVFADCFYIESPDRSAGIKVIYANSGLKVGQAVDATGVVTSINGDKQLTNAQIMAVQGLGVSIAPLGLINKCLGGATGPGQQGSVGLTTLGLLVRTWGVVKSVNDASRSFSITDGCNVQVKVIVPEGVSLPQPNTFVAVTGISCAEAAVDGSVMRAIRVRSASDIVYPGT